MRKIHIGWGINFSKKIVFIYIGKNASTSIKNELLKNNFNNFEIDQIEKLKKYSLKILSDFRFLTIIRNPENRYVSGLGHFLFRNIDNQNQLIPKIEKLLKYNKFYIDEHTAPQTLTLKKSLEIFENAGEFERKKININLFRYEQNLNNLFEKILDQNIEIPYSNSSFFSEERKRCHMIASELYKKYCQNNDLFYQYYEDDFKLHEKSIEI